MYNTSNMLMCPYLANMAVVNACLYGHLPWHYYLNAGEHKGRTPIILKDYGPNPFTVNIEDAAEQNEDYRIALWTGKHLQITLMSIEVGDEIGLEMHPDHDQFIRIEEGRGLITMGDKKDVPNFRANVKEDFIAVIPAGKWHNLINTGNKPIKLYSIYAPPEHPFGTIQKTKRQGEDLV